MLFIFKKLITVVCYVGFLSCSTNALCQGWINKNQVGRLVVHDVDDVIYVHTTAAVGSQTCPNSANIMVVRRSHPKFKELYAALLTALTTRMFFGGWVAECSFNLPVLQRVDLLAESATPYP